MMCKLQKEIRNLIGSCIVISFAGSAISIRTMNLANIPILTGGKQLQEVETRDWIVVDT